MPKQPAAEHDEIQPDLKAYRVINGISHDPTGKTWAPGELLYEDDLPAQTIRDLIKSGDLEKAVEK